MTTDTAPARKPIRTLHVSQFSVPVLLAASGICGGVDGSFETEFKVSARGLTSEGYVTEVRSLMGKVAAAFAGIDSYDPSCAPETPTVMFVASCERLCDGVMNVIHRAVGTERLESADIRVWNLTGYVDLHWERGDEIPEFPRRANEAEVRETRAAYARGDRRSVC